MTNVDWAITGLFVALSAIWFSVGYAVAERKYRGKTE